MIVHTVDTGTAHSSVSILTPRPLDGCCVMSEPERSSEHYAASPYLCLDRRIASQRFVPAEAGTVGCGYLVFGLVPNIQLVMAFVAGLAAVSEPHRAAAGAVEYHSDRTLLDRTPPERTHPDSQGTKRQKMLQREEVLAPQEESRVLETATIRVSCIKRQGRSQRAGKK